MKQSIIFCIAVLFAVSSAVAENGAPETSQHERAEETTSSSTQETAVNSQFLDRAASDYSRYQYQKPRDDSRYQTSQGWSRGNYGYWWGNRGSDIPTSGYTPPAAKR